MLASLKWPDYLILVGFLVISLAIGLYHSLTGGRQKTVAEFIMADRRLRVLPTAISLLMSYQSAILILGMTAEMFSYGAQLLVLSGFSFIANVVIVERLFVPWFYQLKFVSVNEYLYVRFRSNAVRMFTSLMGILASILYMGSCMYAPSAALESVTNFRLMLSIPIMSLVCIAYTALGGMRAVIWTDVFQFLTMLAGMTAIIIKGIMVAGGVGNVIKYASDEGRLNLVDWDPDPTVRHTFWGIIIGGTLAWIPAYGLSQAAIQRFSATKNLASARMSVLLSIPGNVFMEAIAGLTGLVVLAYYSKMKCDPLANNEIHNENQLLPHFVVTLFSDVPGFTGLFLATLYGGALSSVSSMLSGSSANCWEDVLKGRFRHLTETKKAIINRFLVIIFGLLATTVSFLAAALPGPITQISSALCGSVVGPVFGIFMLGGLSRVGNWKGALAGGAVSLVLNMWLSIGSMTVPDKYPSLPSLGVDGCLGNVDFNSSALFNADNNSTLGGTKQYTSTPLYEMQWTPKHQGLQRFYCLSYMWYVTFGLVTSLVVGFTVSLIFRERELENEVEDKLLINFRNFGCSSSVGKEKESQSQKPPMKMDNTAAAAAAANSHNSESEKSPETTIVSSL